MHRAVLLCTGLDHALVAAGNISHVFWTALCSFSDFACGILMIDSTHVSDVCAVQGVKLGPLKTEMLFDIYFFF